MTEKRSPDIIFGDAPEIQSPFDRSIYPSNNVAVAMSGGVDSTVAAALLCDAGFEVTGFTMRLFPDMTTDAEDHAAAAAQKLGIKHIIVDLSDDFDRLVASYFTDEYLAGRTPNPCVICNPLIKWDLLGTAIQEYGFELFATGHYVRIGRYADDTRTLVCGTDKTKDQSYFLWRLNSEMLSRTLFPVGSITKDETRKKAEALGLSIAKRPDSQEICFIPDNDYRRYLKSRIAEVPIPRTITDGDIIDNQGSMLGKHHGVAFYTIGQRRGLGVAAGYPLYVTSLNATDNTVTVGPRNQLASQSFTVRDLRWIRGILPANTISCTIRIRYRHSGATGTVYPADKVIVLDEPQDAVTPGQSAVFYAGEYVLGGGIIEKPL